VETNTTAEGMGIWLSSRQSESLNHKGHQGHKDKDYYLSILSPVCITL